ncbi:adenosine deaminase [Mycoplasmatota bacterium zrk1]
MNSENIDFINALKSEDLRMIEQSPKTDIHNHATRGANINYVLGHKVDEIPECPPKFDSLESMQDWYNDHIKPHCIGLEGFERRIKGAFLQAKNDGIVALVLSLSIDHCQHYDYDFSKYVNRISEIHGEVAPNVDFYPELSYTRTPKVDHVLETIDEILDLDFFRSIDLKGSEADSVDNFIEIFRKAKMKGLLLKAHVGEFGSAESIIDVVNKLNLDEVHHGIRAIESHKVMEFLKERQISLNICPTSNVILDNIEDYEQHPIGKLHRYGIPVTINSDDMVIFNKSVSEEYLKLYQAGVLTAEELDEIRKIGLNNLSKLKKN